MLDIFQSPTPIVTESEEGKCLITLAGSQYSVNSKLQDVISKTAPGKVVEWVSNGDWSMHELLMGLLAQTGPAWVYISSYAFSEKPARIIAELVSSKVITDLKCIIDSRVDTRSASALTLIQNCASNCKLIDTHAKVTVVANNSRQFVVIGSANYTVNHRYESGVIIESFESAVFHQNWIWEAIHGTE